MKVISDIRTMLETVQQVQRSGRTVGVVPTMGALHQGHLSLATAAREECDFVVTTIFVNPTQFAPTEDLDQYPRPIETDLKKLEANGADVAFCPKTDTVYPKDFSTYVQPPSISLPFEGISRTSHFRGVATVVLKLFHMVPAEKAFFGQKDYQQTLVVKKMVEDLNLPVEIVVCPIVREADGLAMSSRNAYLSDEERTRSTSLFQGLRQIQADIETGTIPEAVANGKKIILPMVDELEYLDVVDARTLLSVDNKETQLVALVAARVGKTRLIDNILID